MIFVSAHDIIFGLLEVDNKCWVSMERLHDLKDYIYKILLEEDVNVVMDVDDNAILREVKVNQGVLEIYGNSIYLINRGRNFRVNSEVYRIIKEFVGIGLEQAGTYSRVYAVWRWIAALLFDIFQKICYTNYRS